MKRFLLLTTMLSVPASAQIHFLNPFARPQGAVIATVSTCGLPAAPLSNGYQPKYFQFGGHTWANDSGQTWNTQSSDAIQTCSNGHVIFTMRDNSYYHSASDSADKRRSEMGATQTVDKFHNNKEYWLAWGFKVSLAVTPKSGTNFRGFQMHWPSGASPAWGMSFVNYGAGLGLRITTRNDTQSNVARVTAPIAQGVAHDIVVRQVLNGTAGQLDIWLDGKQILSFRGPVGSTKEDGYTFRIGTYGPIPGNVATYEIGNVASFPSDVNLLARVGTAPAF